MNRRSELFDLKAMLQHETPSAWLVLTEDGKKVWLPKSQVEDNCDGTFTLPEWLAIEKGLV